jgi:hypothetical protein
LLPEEDLNVAVHIEGDSFAGEEDLFGIDDAVSSKIASQLEPSPVLNPVVLSDPCGALKSSPKVDKEMMEDTGLLLKDTIIENETETNNTEKQDVETKSCIDVFVGDDTLDDLFGDDSFIEKTTQMTKELFDEKTQKFKTPKVFGKVITTSVIPNDSIKQCVSSLSTSTVSSAPVGAPQIRQKLFTNPSVSKSTTSVPPVKPALTTTDCTTCVANRLPVASSSCVSFPGNSSKTKETYARQSTITTKSRSQNNQWTRPVTVSNVKPAQNNMVQGQRNGGVGHGGKVSASTNFDSAKNTSGIVFHGQNVNLTKPHSSSIIPTIRPRTMPNSSVSGACSQNKTITGTGIANFGAKLSTRSTTYPPVKSVTAVKQTVHSQTVTKVAKSGGQSINDSNNNKAVPVNKIITSSSSTTDCAYFGDLSLSEDLLFQLAEPDDILDSQVCNSGSSSGSVDHNQAGQVELSVTRNKSKTPGGLQYSSSSVSSRTDTNVIARSSANLMVNCTQSRSTLTSGCKSVVSNSTVAVISSKISSSVPTQSGVRSSQKFTNSREASTMILDDSDIGIPPTQFQRRPTKGPKAQKFSFKSTNLSQSGVNAVTRSQVKSSSSANTKHSENVQEKPGPGNKSKLFY